MVGVGVGLPGGRGRVVWEVRGVQRWRERV